MSQAELERIAGLADELPQSESPVVRFVDAGPATPELRSDSYLAIGLWSGDAVHQADDQMTKDLDRSFDSFRALLCRDEAQSRLTHELGTMTNTDDVELDELESEVRRLVREHLHLNSIDLHARTVAVRDTINDRLAGLQSPRHRQQLLVLGSIVLAMLADTYVGVGEYVRASRTAEGAFQLAGVAEVRPLMRWCLGLRAYADFHAYGPARAVGQLNRMPLQLDDPPLERVIDLNARALFEAERANPDAALAAHDALTETEAMVTGGPSFFADWGGMLDVPLEKRLQFRAGAYNRLGDHDAAGAMARQSLDIYESNPAEQRAYGNEADCRITIAQARLHNGDLDNSIDAITPVLELPVTHRAAWFVKRLDDYAAAFRTDTIAGSSSTVTALAERMNAFRSETAQLPSPS